MSFEQYSQYPPAPGQEGAPGQVSSQQDGMTSPQGDPSQQAPFSPQVDAGNGAPGQGGEGKTTLWYVYSPKSELQRFDLY